MHFIVCQVPAAVSSSSEGPGPEYNIDDIPDAEEVEEAEAIDDDLLQHHLYESSSFSSSPLTSLSGLQSSFSGHVPAMSPAGIARCDSLSTDMSGQDPTWTQSQDVVHILAIGHPQPLTVSRYQVRVVVNVVFVPSVSRCFYPLLSLTCALLYGIAGRRFTCSPSVLRQSCGTFLQGKGGVCDFRCNTFCAKPPSKIE